MKLPKGFRWEIYLYDRKKIQSEHDDPRGAILFHYPKELQEDVVIVRAGHFASLYVASKAFFEEEEHSKALFKTSTGYCQVWPLHEGQLLIIALAVFDTIARENELIQSESYLKCLIEDIEKCITMLFAPVPGCSSFSKCLFNAVDLTELMESYCHYFLKQTITYKLHNEQTARTFTQIRKLFRHLNPIHQWVLLYSKDGQSRKTPVLQTCESPFISPKETLWLSMMKEFWRRRQEKQWTKSIIAVAIKNWRDLDIKHVCNCNSEVFNESLADSIRGKLIKLSEFESRNPSQCCSTLYIQRSNDRSYGMLLRTCIKNIDKETIHYLWTTCMAKMENMVLEVKTQIQSH